MSSLQSASPAWPKSDLPALWRPRSRPVRAYLKNCRIWELASSDLRKRLAKLASENLCPCLIRFWASQLAAALMAYGLIREQQFPTTLSATFMQRRP